MSGKFCNECHFEMEGWCDVCGEAYCLDCDRVCPNEDAHPERDDDE